MMPHRIGTLVFEAEYHGSSDPIVFRKDFSDVVQQSLLDAIEEVLDELNPTNKSILRLNKLELTLDSIDYPFNEWEFKQQLKRRLREELNYKIVSIRHQQKNQILSEEGDTYTIKRNQTELLLFFLKNGFLPWWTSESNQHKVSIGQLIGELQKDNPKLLFNIIKEIAEDKIALRRCMYHFPEKAFYEWISNGTVIRSSLLEGFLAFISQSDLKNEIGESDLLIREFLTLQRIDLSTAIDSINSLQLLFINYLLQYRYIKKDQIAVLFPEYLISSWIKLHLPDRFMFFDHYVTYIPVTISSSVRKRSIEFLFQYILHNSVLQIDDFKKQFIRTEIEKITGHLIPDSFYSLSVNFPNKSFEELSTKPSEIYYNILERKILQFLRYGIIDWEDQAIGVEAIEKYIGLFHESSPDHLESIFKQIEPSFYFRVLKRIEERLSPAIRSILLRDYFDKKKVEERTIFLEYRTKLLTVFFSHGIIPWEYALEMGDLQTIESHIQNFYQQDQEYFIRMLNAILKQNPDFLERIETLFSNNFYLFITELIQKHTSYTSNSSEQAGVGVSKKSEIPATIDLILYCLIYFEKKQRLPDWAGFTLENLVKHFMEVHPDQAKLFFTVAAYQKFRILKERFASELTLKIEEWLKAIYADKLGAHPEDSNNKRIQTFAGDKPLKIEEPIYITNAGLILVHPFLQRFFSICGLLDKRKFKDEIAAHKAVHLLQYIAFKTIGAEEHQLVLNKLLCGVPIKVPIDRSIELTEEEKDTSESLIRGVIENWPILKKTSNENFRASLLQREGKLMFEESVVKLKVEERGYDVLLDKLPWNISMIKLPWMEKMLQVNWR